MLYASIDGKRTSLNGKFMNKKGLAINGCMVQQMVLVEKNL